MEYDAYSQTVRANRYSPKRERLALGAASATVANECAATISSTVGMVASHYLYHKLRVSVFSNGADSDLSDTIRCEAFDET